MLVKWILTERYGEIVVFESVMFVCFAVDVSFFALEQVVVYVYASDSNVKKN